MSALCCEKCTSFRKSWVHEGSESHYGETLIGSINVLWILCFWFHCWFSSLSLFSVLILSKWNAILKLLLSLYLCIWYYCCFYYFLLSSYTMSKTCDHFTASGKHVWNFACMRACMVVPVYLQFKHMYSLYCKYLQRFLCQQIRHHSFSGSSYHIDMLKCETFQTPSLLEQ